jgi:hypothetical protein
VEKVLSALGHPDRLGIVLWLMEHGPVRQVEILGALEGIRGETVNPGAVTALLKPLFESGILERARPRAPIAVRDPTQTAIVLKAAAAIGGEHADDRKRDADGDFEALRRALIAQAPVARSGSGGDEPR